MAHEIKKVEKTFLQLDLYRNGDGPKTHLLVPANPFNNCQLFTIGAINHLIISNVTEDEVKDLLSAAIQHAEMRRLCILDIQRNYVDRILEKLKPFITEVVYNQPYISTNNSEMNTVMVKFNLEKFK